MRESVVALCPVAICAVGGLLAPKYTSYSCALLPEPEQLQFEVSEVAIPVAAFPGWRCERTVGALASVGLSFVQLIENTETISQNRSRVGLFMMIILPIERFRCICQGQVGVFPFSRISDLVGEYATGAGACYLSELLGPIVVFSFLIPQDFRLGC